MVRPVPQQVGDNLGSILLAIGLFVSMSALVALCARQTRHSPKKASEAQLQPKSPLASPRHLVTTIGIKAMPFINKKKSSGDDEGDIRAKEEGTFGEDGLWQKAILMGDKCRLPEFSGAIYYDSYGNRLAEPPPRSPRANLFTDFSFPMAKDSS